MTSTPNDQQLEDAMTWLLRLSEAETSDLHRQHQDWLLRDPAHETAWLQVSKAWAMMGRTATREAASASAASNVHRLPPRRASRMVQGIALAAAACLLIAVSPLLLQQIAADYTTTTAQQRQVPLADGSRLHLGGETAIAVEVGSAARNVKLLKGHAFFDVARDEARPFTVQAGEVSIAVLGTAFDVNLTDTMVTVAVKRGAVAVQAGKTGPQRIDERLAPGDHLAINRSTGVAVASKSQPDDIAGWVDGKLFVVNTPLSEAVAELRRYRAGWIVIADADLGQKTVTGLYNLQTPDSALQAMLQPVGGRVHQMTPWLTVISPAGK